MVIVPGGVKQILFNNDHRYAIAYKLSYLEASIPNYEKALYNANNRRQLSFEQRIS